MSYSTYTGFDALNTDYSGLGALRPPSDWRLPAGVDANNITDWMQYGVDLVKLLPSNVIFNPLTGATYASLEAGYAATRGTAATTTSGGGGNSNTHTSVTPPPPLHVDPPTGGFDLTSLTTTKVAGIPVLYLGLGVIGLYLLRGK